jgi:hypothetical protein
MTDAEYMEQLAAVSGLISEWVRIQDFPFTHPHPPTHPHTHTHTQLLSAASRRRASLDHDHEKQGLAEYVREQIRDTNQRPVLVRCVHACGLVVRVDMCHSRLL